MGSTYFNKRIPTRTATRRPRSRAKTFNTEEGAKAYAEVNKLKKYSIVQAKKGKYTVKEE